MGDVEGDPAAVGEGSFQNGAGGETRMSQERGRSCSEHRRQWREECVCVCVCACVCITGALKCFGESLGRQTPAAPPTCQFLTPADPKCIAQ